MEIRSRNISIFVVNNCLQYNMKSIALVFLCVFAVSSFGQSKLSFELERKRDVYDFLTKAITNQDSLKMAEGYYQMGKNEAGLGNYIFSNAWYRKAMPIYRELNQHFDYGRMYQRMAENEAVKKNFKQTLVYADSALGIFKRYGLAKGIISSYLFKVAFNYEQLKKSPEESLRNFDQMLTLTKLPQN